MKRNVTFGAIGVLLLMNLLFEAVIFRKLDEMSSKKLYFIEQTLDHLLLIENKKQEAIYDEQLRRNAERHQYDPAVVDSTPSWMDAFEEPEVARKRQKIRNRRR